MRATLLLAGLAAALLLPAPRLSATSSRPDATIAPALLTRAWPARWITHPESDGVGYEVLLFRRTLSLPAVPATFRVHVSGDNRYRLWVNGRSIVTGPQRDDATHWRFETLDLAPHLRAGENVLAVQVWNYGEHRPLALMSVETGLILQGDGEAEAVINSDASWRVQRHAGLSPIPIPREELNTYIVVAPGERLDGDATPWGWTESGFDDTRWPAARELAAGTPHGYGVDIVRWLAPRNLPLMEETPQRGLRIRRSEGFDVHEQFLTGDGALRIPPRSRGRILLDQGVLTTAFPELRTSGGRGAVVTLEYAEAMFDAQGEKGHRDEIEGREVVGIRDQFLPDGGPGRVFSTMDYRTFRYLKLTVETGDEPLVLEDLHSRFTGYPLEEHAWFRSNEQALATIWDVGWRTARLCAYETYIDCPYYEQLQYLGDTRIQALISLYVSGDDRLMRQAIDLFDRSRQPDGLTQSRYPSRHLQVINTFSLWWISMLHDYHQLRDDPAFLRSRLPGVAGVLAWFERHLDRRTGLLGPLPYWTFVDWPDEWPWDPTVNSGGEPPGARSGGSAIVTLQYALALQQAADLLASLGEPAPARAHRQQAAALLEAVRRHCWVSERGLFADSADRQSFSQHVNALAVLAGAVEGEAATELMERTLNNSELTPCTLYFQFYLLRAAKAAGLGDRYLDELGPWHDMLERGLTTFAERPDPTRSDCHAWSASPVYEFLATVAGIEPAAAGFAAVRIAPHPGDLTEFDAGMPHPAGLIEVKWRRRGAGMEADVILPAGLTGEFEWQGRTAPLKPGPQTLAW